MALTKASRSMLNTGISDSSDATALTFSSAEDATFAGHVSLADSKKIKLGASGDLEIYHDGTHSYVADEGQGNLIIEGNNVRIQANGGAGYAFFTSGGAADLYHNGSIKLSTASDGIDVTGHIDAATITTTGAGTIGGNLTVTGNLQVDGTTTTINSTTYTVDDKNITLASGAGSSSAADGAGITIDGASATWNYVHSDTSWTANKNIKAPRFLQNGSSNSTFYAAEFSRSGSGSSPDIWGTSNVLVLGYAAGSRSVTFNSSGADFAGTIDTVGRIQVSGTTDQQLVLNSTDDGAVYMALSRTTGGRHGYMGFGGSSDTLFLTNETSGGNTVIQTNGTTAISVDSSQNTTVSNHLIVDGNTTLGNADTDTVTIPGDLAVDTDTLFVDVSADRVGINDNSPDEVLTLKSDAGGIRIKGVTTATKGLSLRYDESAGESEIRSDQTGVNQINLKYRALNHIFGRNNALEYMRITDGGLVGIGRTPSTGNLLDVAGKGYFGSVGTDEGDTKANMGTNAVLQLKPHDGNSTNMTFAQVSGGSGMGIQVSNSSQTANWDIALNPYGGNVGVGTVDPAAEFHVHAASPQVRLTSSSDSGTPLAQIGYAAGSGYFLRLGDAANNEDVMIRSYGNTVFNGGNVGIGTSSPVYGLDVRSTGYFSTASGTNNLTLGDSTNGTTAAINSNNNNLIFLGNGSTEHARVSTPTGTDVTKFKVGTNGSYLAGDMRVTTGNTSGGVAMNTGTMQEFRNVCSSHGSGSNNYWHIKTNFKCSNNIMFVARMHGYAYGNSGSIIDVSRSGYAYAGSGGSIINSQTVNNGNSSHTLECYEASDDYVCFRGYWVGGYYTGASFDIAMYSPTGYNWNFQIISHALNTVSGSHF